MRPEPITKLLREQPFRPFRITLSNGRTHDVRHPELAMVGRDTVFIGDPAADLPENVYDHFHLLTLLHINNVELLPLPTAPDAHGASQ